LGLEPGLGLGLGLGLEPGLGLGLGLAPRRPGANNTYSPLTQVRGS